MTSFSRSQTLRIMTMSLTFHFFGKYSNAEVAIKDQKTRPKVFGKGRKILSSPQYCSSHRSWLDRNFLSIINTHGKGYAQVCIHEKSCQVKLSVASSKSNICGENSWTTHRRDGVGKSRQFVESKVHYWYLLISRFRRPTNMGRFLRQRPSSNLGFVCAQFLARLERQS